MFWSVELKASKNGFRRKFMPVTIKVKNALNLPSNLYGFVGGGEERLILKNYADHLHLFSVDSNFNTLDTIKVQYPSSFNTTTNIYKDMQSPLIYFSNPYGDIYVYNSDRLGSYKIANFRFDNLKAISRNTIIVRARHKDGMELNRNLAKLVLSDSVILNKQYFLPKQVSSFFTNDGLLYFDKEYSRVLYMYFYRGEYLTLDTNLVLVYKGKTIDTTKTIQIKTSVFNEKTKEGNIDKQITPIKPPRFVNRFITSSKGKIYVLSALKADNEIKSDFSSNQVVDVYSIIDGKYLYSFYIPKYKNKNLNEFQIREKRLIAIFGSSLVDYVFVD